MRSILLRVLAAMLLLLAASGARAAFSCTSITSAGYNTVYAANSTDSLQLSFTITCSRGSTRDPTTLDYSVAVNNGQTSFFGLNLATLSGSFLYYELYTNGCGGTQWTANNPITGSITWAANQTGQATDTKTYWGCITVGQNPATTGVYRDTVTMTATYNTGTRTGNQTVTGSIPIAIFGPARCDIDTSQANVSIVYPSFSPTDQVQQSQFTATCTSPLSYTLSVSPASGTLAGVNYNVNRNAAGGTGTGAPQNYTITVTAPAGQSGTCNLPNCTASQTHTLTVTY